MKASLPAKAWPSAGPANPSAAIPSGSVNGATGARYQTALSVDLHANLCEMVETPTVSSRHRGLPESTGIAQRFTFAGSYFAPRDLV
jgi:hypothetical protein